MCSPFFRKPRRFPAFAVGEDTFLVADPFVRAKHLDRIEIWFRGEKVPAREVARIECPEAVVLKASRAVKGISPLAFSRGDPVEKQVWTWRRSAMSVRASEVGTNTMTEVMAATGRSCEEILEYYYPGTTLRRLALTDNPEELYGF